MSSWRLDDRWLWLGLGVFAVIAARSVGYALQETSRLTEIHEKPKKQICTISQDTEDALDTRALGVLAQGHDRAIKNTAITILADRFLRDQSLITSLTIDFFSSDPEIRTKARNLCLLLEQTTTDPRPIAFLLRLEGSTTPPLPQIPASSRLREHEESFEEQELRRRRREAMVFHDGIGPISQDDIIQRIESESPVLRRAGEIIDEAMRDNIARRDRTILDF